MEELFHAVFTSLIGYLDLLSLDKWHPSHLKLNLWVGNSSAHFPSFAFLQIFLKGGTHSLLQLCKDLLGHLSCKLLVPNHSEEYWANWTKLCTGVLDHANCVEPGSRVRRSLKSTMGFNFSIWTDQAGNINS